MGICEVLCPSLYRQKIILKNSTNSPKYADKDVINPGSVMLSGVMLFDFIGWKEAARLIESSMEKTIQQKFVTYDFERQMQSATKAKTSELATRMIENM
jgi:isocitrate dehydrogenase